MNCDYIAKIPKSVSVEKTDLQVIDAHTVPLLLFQWRWGRWWPQNPIFA